MCLSQNKLDSVIFRDESRFNLGYSDKKQYVWHIKGAAILSRNMILTVKHSGGL